MKLLQKKKAKIFVEVFPPYAMNRSKHHTTPDEFRNHIKEIKEQHPNATVVVTTRPQLDSIYWAKSIQKDYKMDVVLNVTCIGESLPQIKEKLQRIHQEGIKDLLVLRGYSSKIETSPDEAFTNGLDFLKFVVKENQQQKYKFNLGVAAYPEGHPNSSFDSSLDNLFKKVDLGIQFAITQASYDIEQVELFYKRLREKGVKIPIYFGILPLISKEVLERKAPASKVKVPLIVKNLFANKDPNEFEGIGKKLMKEHTNRLMKMGENNFCLFSMNSPETSHMMDEFNHDWNLFSNWKQTKLNFYKTILKFSTFMSHRK